SFPYTTLFRSDQLTLGNIQHPSDVRWRGHGVHADIDGDRAFFVSGPDGLAGHPLLSRESLDTVASNRAELDDPGASTLFGLYQALVSQDIPRLAGSPACDWRSA